MAEVLVNGIAALQLELHRPKIGPWFINADLDGVDVPSGTATITVGDGLLTLVGTIVPQRSGAFVERVRVRIVGGAGGLGKTLAPKFYAGVELQLPLSELLQAVGEKLAATSDAGAMATSLQKWTRLGVPAHEALATLVDVAGVSWRTRDDGSIWVGPETWPTATIDYALIDEDFEERRVHLATDDPTLRPGVTLDGRQLSYVVYTYRPDSTRVEAWVDLDERDRLRAGLAKYVRGLVDPRIDALAKYAATVVRQASDGTLELAPDSRRLPGLVGIPIRSAFPGVTAKVAPGTRCDVAFEDGNLARPMVVAFDGGGLKELVVTADTVVTVSAPNVRIADGDIPIARVGDLVSIMMPAAVVPGAGAVIYTPLPSGMAAFGTIVSGSANGKTK